MKKRKRNEQSLEERGRTAFLSLLLKDLQLFAFSFLEKAELISLRNCSKYFYQLVSEHFLKVIITINRAANTDRGPVDITRELLENILSSIYSPSTVFGFNFNYVHFSSTMFSHLPSNIQALYIFWRGSKFPDDGIPCFQYLPSSLKSLELSFAPLLGRGFQSLPTSLQMLDLSHCTKQITYKGIKYLPSSLTELNLSHCKIPDGDILKYLPLMLSYLDLSHSNVTSNGIKYLPDSLNVLGLQGCDIVTIHSLPSSLKKLDLSRCIDIQDYERVCYLLPSSLKELNLAFCYKINSKGIRYLPPSLETLNLNNCSITDNDLQHLPSSLKSLNLNLCKITDNGLKYLPISLTSLDLRWNLITANGLRYLPSSLKTLSIGESKYNNIIK